jgi:putative MATE family efflux protein
MIKRFDLANRYIGDRAFYREVAVVALPIVLQQLIATAMGFIDSVMVGQIGAQAMASVSVSNKYFMIMQAMLFGVTGGLCIFISQYYGADDHEKGQGLFVINALGSLSLAGLFLILISAAPRAMLSVFVNDPATIDYGLSYLNYIRFSYLPFAVSLASMSALRAIGQTRKPLLISSSAILLNTGLNYLLIFGNFGFPAMGIGGAGLATLISRLVEMFLYLLLLSGNKQYFNLKIEPIRRLLQVTRKTLSLTGNELLWSAGTVLIFKTYCLVNEANIASLAIVETTSNLIFVLFGGFAAAIAVMVGTRLGASRFEEARQNSRRLLALGLVVGLFSFVLIFLISGQISSVSWPLR